MNRNAVMQAGFWILALSWLPAAVIMKIVNYEQFHFSPMDWVEILRWEAPRLGLVSNPDVSTLQLFWPVLAVAAVIFAYISLPPALLCRQLWRLGYRRSAWTAGLAIAIATVFVIGGTGKVLEEINLELGRMMFFLPVWTAAYMALFSLLLCVGLVLLSRRS